MTPRYTTMKSPIGDLLLTGDGTALTGIWFASRRRRPDAAWIRDPAALREARSQLEAYFAGELRDFDLALRPEGTPFQKAVWKELARIPYGRTISYGDLARRIGSPKAFRAVGTANGANRIPIVLPCHRVIAGDGTLGGYGGGLPVKRTLLALEGAL